MRKARVGLLVAAALVAVPLAAAAQPKPPAQPGGEQPKEVNLDEPPGDEPATPPEDQPAVELNQDVLDRYRPEMRKYYFDPSRHRTYLDQLGVKYPTVR